MSYAISDFPNLQSSIWDGIRVPCRRSVRQIGEDMCEEAGLDTDLVRVHVHTGSRPLPQGVANLRCRIVVAMQAEGYTLIRAGEWFEGFSQLTLQRFAVDGRKLLKEEANA